MGSYVTSRDLTCPPRLPLQGMLDLTYRCNCDCRHCWLHVDPDAPERQDEMTVDEIKSLVAEARRMGCRSWVISGGEPMLRADFPEIMGFIIASSRDWALNTNGTLITRRIAKLLASPGMKMVALYGATPEVNDHVTRRPGSFEMLMRGLHYLREAGAAFIVQVIPMRDNFHQLDSMIELAKTLSPRWRIGTSWLFLSASGDEQRNREILRQRLDPLDAARFDLPETPNGGWLNGAGPCRRGTGDDRLLGSCLERRRDFHVDPYGRMSFCTFAKHPDLNYDLRQGSFRECWDAFLPALADRVRGGAEYLEACDACDLRDICRWCPVFGYLEHRRFSAKVEYLCSVARETSTTMNVQALERRRFFGIAGITIQVDSDLPITESTFDPKFVPFRKDGPGEDTIAIRHHFSLPALEGRELGREVYRRAPWVIYESDQAWTYIEGEHDAYGALGRMHQVAVFDRDYRNARIYSEDDATFRRGGLQSLTLLPSDQLLIAKLLADREGCYIHSSGVDLGGRGLLFVGHSEAGKSTIAGMLKGTAEILCDDRVIVRRHADGIRIHGTWSHGDIPDVSSRSVPLHGIFFLVQAPLNRITRMQSVSASASRLLECLVKPYTSADWWEKELALVERIVSETPCYKLEFDRSGGIVALLLEV